MKSATSPARFAVLTVICGWALFAGGQTRPSRAQDAKAQPPADTAAAGAESIDEISQQASQLEADLGKLRDNTPEAAELLTQLVDLYYADGRALGLVRVGEIFVGKHAEHPKHKDVMAKTIEGLVATTRNSDVVAMARQFLLRYPEAAECAHVERLLARSLDQINQPADAASAYEAIWRRSPASEEGLRAAILAMQRYSAVNSVPALNAAAEIAETLLASQNAGEFASEVGWQAVDYRRRAAEYAKSNLAASKLLEKSPPRDKLILSGIHQTMANNYANLGQRSNAVVSWQQARALGDSELLHRSHIMELYYVGAKPEEMEPVVNDYLLKYAQQPDRLAMRSYLALILLRAPETLPRGLAILAELLPDDAVTNSNAVHYLNNTANEPAANAQAEQVLLAALAKNTRDAAFLRWTLGLSLYRDRLKDIPKARQVIRDLVTLSPSNDTYTGEGIKWLLYTAPDDAEFNADVARLLKVRAERAHWTAHRDFLAAWIREAINNKDSQQRAAAAQAALNADPGQAQIAEWVAAESQDVPTAQAARSRLLASTLTDEQARLLYRNQAESFRYAATAEQKAQCGTIYGQMAQRFPQDFAVAVAYLEATTDFGTPEASQAAAAHLLTLQPPANFPNTWYRLTLAADRAANADLLKRSYDWIQQSQQKFGPDNGYAEYIGDALEKYKFANEALDYYRRGVQLNRNVYSSRVCADRLVTKLTGPERKALLEELIAADSDYHGTYASWLASDYVRPGEGKTPDLEQFERTMRASLARQIQRPFRAWGLEEYIVQQWVDEYRNGKDHAEADRRRVFQLVRDLKFGRPSAAATLALLELAPEKAATPMERLLAIQEVTTTVDDIYLDWDRLLPYAQASLGRQDYIGAATLLTGMLANIPAIDADRQKSGRDLVALCYSRIGSVGLTIDESSPIAPLMQAALYLRLGDERLALEAYTANKALFDQHRREIPVDLLLFVCENHIAAGGDENFDRAEDILRSWLVALGDVKEIDDGSKARVQLLLAKNYFKSRRFDVARSEYTTVLNRFPTLPEAIEAEFGIGESYMAQKVYDQAELVFERLAGSKDRDTVVRAEFLRGVLASHRGDLDEARRIFRGVLERVPSVELANETLFNLSEVYGAEQRYVDQLELLRTVGRLGSVSKRWHAPGSALSIVVQDSDLGISRGHSRIPVRITTEPGGDEETVYLYSGGAGKGLFRADLETRLGKIVKNNKLLELSGNDVIHCDYPPEFKADFRNVILTDAQIQVASDGRFFVASSKIIDKEEETFTQKLQREEQERENADQRRSQGRPENQVKPGNLIYLRTEDPDRDLTDSADPIMVKLVASSGDQAQIKLQETEPHSGIFEGVAKTGELPAGALASDTSIDHSPLMAIDRDPQTYWLSEPDGATPKWLSVDMKDQRTVDQVTFRSPNPAREVPVRGVLEGSQDGRYWFAIGSHPPVVKSAPLAENYGKMTIRVFAGSYVHFTDWNQVADLCKNSKPIEEDQVSSLAWSLPAESEPGKLPHAVVWHGKFLQPRSGAVRFSVQGVQTALAMDGNLELPLGLGGRTVDLWLERGTHDLSIFSAVSVASQGASATLAHANYEDSQVTLVSFRPADFDLEDPLAKPALARERAQLTQAEGVWDFQFDPIEVRHVRLRVDEYLGDALAISQVEISSEQGSERHIPTEADVLALSENDVLEIAAGDTIVASYTDEFTQSASGRSQLLTARLQATYYDSRVQPIALDFVRQADGVVVTVRKELMRIDPGDRVIVEIIDYDLDQSDQPDQLKFQVSVNDGEPIELTAQETEPYSGIFTKEVDTSSKPEEGKLTVKRGDRIYCTYVDAQNTFPGHAVPREAIVYVTEPSNGRVRIVESRAIRSTEDVAQPAQIIYLPPGKDQAKKVNQVAYEAPFTVEVIDRDAARDSLSKVIVHLATTDGAAVDVECVISDDYLASSLVGEVADPLEEGRFLGQVVLQLGGKQSPSLVPRSPSMPLSLIGGAKLSDQEKASGGETLVTRVLNVTGKDVISATYNDAQRPEGKPKDLLSRGRLIANGVLDCTDREYREVVTQLHVGEKLFLRVNDPDLDISDERDLAKVEISSPRGELETVQLEETLAHAGVFTGSVMLQAQEKPQPGNIKAEAPIVETFFGDTLQLRYVDHAASTESGTLESTQVVPVVVGTDGLVAAFSKAFGEENLAVETQFHIAESYFELFKSHKKLARADEQREDLEAGRRVLREVMEDYPNPKHIPRIAYLLGQFSQELGQWDEAIVSYQLIVRQYADSMLAPDAQYKLAQCHEEAGNFDDALEAYVTLAATYPKSPLIANVMIRISERFYKDENYEVAAQVGEKFLEKFDGHQWAPKMAFRVGQCYYKAKDFGKGALSFDKFAKIFPDDELCADALFWSGESYRQAGNSRDAFRRYNRCRWDFPSSDAAKYSRGRLALPAMLAQFEAEANAVEDEE